MKSKIASEPILITWMYLYLYDTPMQVFYWRYFRYQSQHLAVNTETFEI